MSVDKEKFDLKPIQYQELYDEEEIPLKSLRKGTLRFVYYWGSVLCVVGLILSVFIKIPVEQRFNFVLHSTEKEFTYRQAEFLNIERIDLQTGDIVKKGQGIAEVNSPVTGVLIAAYLSAENSLMDFKMHDAKLLKEKLEELEAQLQKITIGTENDSLRLKYTLAEKQEATSRLNQAFKNSFRIFTTNQELYGKDVISKEELLLSEVTYKSDKALYEEKALQFDRAISDLKGKIQDQHMQKVLILSQKETTAMQYEKEHAYYTKQIEDQRSKIELQFGPFKVIDNKNLLLLAPSNGKLTHVHSKKSGVLAQGEILFKIKENSGSLVALSDVESNRISYIGKGQKAILQISTFPYFEWGVVEGYVQTVNRAPSLAGTFPFEIKLTKENKLKGKLHEGMTGNASIVTESKTIWGLIFGKLHSWKDGLYE
jgi:multidrug efflux pump subunit AcrA (membrane-fusion protein)